MAVLKSAEPSVLSRRDARVHKTVRRHLPGGLTSAGHHPSAASAAHRCPAAKTPHRVTLSLPVTLSFRRQFDCLLASTVTDIAEFREALDRSIATEGRCRTPTYRARRDRGISLR